MSPPRLTVAICARDAAATIGRAVASAVATCAEPILLVDDFSSDATVDLARAAGGARLRVVRPPVHTTVAGARAAALAALDTPYALWLDADDELLPGRLEALLPLLEAGADLVFDGVELWDGEAATLRSVFHPPAFLRRPGGAAWMLERNWLPTIGWPAFRVAALRAQGYDPGLACAEDYDIVRRCIAAGAVVAWSDHVGYRAHTYAGGLSRRLEVCRAAYRTIFARTEAAALRAAYARAGLGVRAAVWAEVSLALFRGEEAAALALVEVLPSAGDDVPDADPGPYAGIAEAWRLPFQRGTLRTRLGRPGGLEDLEAAAARDPGAAEGWNNLGVARRAAGDAAGAAAAFARALALRPDYLDARLNADNGAGARLTLMPLRRLPDRGGYPLPNARQQHGVATRGSNTR